MTDWDRAELGPGRMPEEENGLSHTGRTWDTETGQLHIDNITQLNMILAVM